MSIEEDYAARARGNSDIWKHGPSTSPIRGFVQNLDKWQFLYRNTRDQKMHRITAPLLEAA